MHILLTGATGFIGGHLLIRLLEQGHEITACVRRPDALPQRPGIRIVPLDFGKSTAPGDWRPHLHNIDAVINCVGIIAEEPGQSFENLHHRAPVALFGACAQRGMRRVIQISALGADETAFSRYHLSKTAADDHLAQLPLDWIVLQPSLVYGPGGKSTLLLSALAALPVIPLIGTGDQRLQPVCVDDLAETVLRCLEPDAPVRERIPVVGPQPVTVRDMLRHLRRWLGLGHARFLPVPARSVLSATDLAGRVFPSAMNGEAIRMLQQGNVGDAEPLTRLLRRKPVSVEQALTRRPALPAERQQARLHFVLPALRVTLALLWLWSGFVSAFVFPREASREMLAAFGITGTGAIVTLYGAALLDALLGAALLWRYRIRLTGALQIGLMLVYSAGLALYLPEFWLHPFAPVAKNIPIILATLAVMAAAEV